MDAVLSFNAGVHETAYGDDERPESLFNFSCTTFVIPPNDPHNYQFHIFFNLPIDQTFIVQRSGVYCILCENLTTVLYQRVATCDPEVEKIPSDLLNIMTGWAQGQSQHVELATTHVPSLIGSFKDPSRGYRTLATPRLSTIYQLILPPPDTDNNRELFALNRMNPQSLEYADMYAPSGLNPDTHFILIFNLQPITPSPSLLGPSPIHNLSPFIRNKIHSWAWEAADVSPLPSPTTSVIAPSPTDSAISPSASASVTAFYTGAHHKPSPIQVTGVPTSYNLPYLYEASRVTSPLFLTEGANTSYVEEPDNSDGIGHGPYFQHSDGNATASDVIADDVEPEAQRSYQSAIAPTTQSGTDVMGLCHRLGCTNENIVDAKFRGGAKSLCTMVRNHRAMLSVLQMLGFCDLGTRPPFVKGKVVTFGDGAKFSIEETLREFGWTWDSFKHKATWYLWAEDAVRSSEWDPTRLPDADDATYKVWLSIKYFWGPSGPLQTGNWLERTVDDARDHALEDAAKVLVQSTVSANRTAISQYLIPKM